MITSAMRNRRSRLRAVRCLGSLLALSLFGFVAMAADQPSTPAHPAIPDTLQQRIVACTTCHGVHGEGTPGSGYFPRLAGKPAAYLARQMQDLQNGLRK
jgi:cytochrome c553